MIIYDPLILTIDPKFRRDIQIVFSVELYPQIKSIHDDPNGLLCFGQSKQSGGFLEWWYPTTMGFPTRNDHFGVFWGYHHFGKPLNSRVRKHLGWFLLVFFYAFYHGKLPLFHHPFNGNIFGSQIQLDRGPKTKTCKLPLSSRTNGADEKAGWVTTAPPLAVKNVQKPTLVGFGPGFCQLERIGKCMGNHPVKHGLILGIPFFAAIL